ncbi:ABC transporter ATP-binding protein [Streptomyces litchfieldiae]|uniref:ABC transporter ATP-binding protein n=1 Tax=Streptomyces litchfieldiae TaxID=3075543 RepID=A0ABU2MU48_9ACTN|nr:ABC transporter ATP-binding protein [Streptomyces sp. DSM 44938]MDT0344609.1 ABC transporter ATP-binding protein [Streptomyces sp. DSM 44938]
MRTDGPSGGHVLRSAIAAQWRGMGIGALLGAGHQVGEALVPVLIGVVIDRAVAGDDTGGLVFWLAVLALVYLGLSTCFRFAARVGERAAERAAHDLRLGLVRRVVHPGGGTERGHLPGALTSIAAEDTRRVGSFAMALMLGIAALAGLLTGAVALLRVSTELGLLVLLGTPLLLWLTHLLSKPLEHRSTTEQERAAHASGVAADLVTGLRILKGLGAVPAAVARYRRVSRASLTATLRAARAEAWQSGMTTGLTGLFIAAVALVGGRLAAGGSISLGQLVSAVGLALFLLGPLATLSWVSAELAQGRASAARVAAVLDAPAAVTAAGRELSRPVAGRLRLSGVDLGGSAGSDLEAAPGEILGVAVTEPAHATRLLDLLTRETESAAGSVELDGVPVNDLDPAEYRTAVLVAAHDADLFAGTVAENVAAGAPDGGDLTAALTAAAADDVVRSLPEGAGTPVGERGRALSGGQRQRVALARALAADPPVLVLHDPTTAVDAVTEARVAAGLRRLRTARPDRTTVLVTTSPALLAVADRVVLVDDGRVVDAAPHAVLAERHPAYRAAVLT